MEKEIVIVHSKYVVCTGPDAPHDHPIVYYLIPDTGRNYSICFYCSKKFIYEEQKNDRTTYTNGASASTKGTG